MYGKLCRRLGLRQMTIGAAALSCAAIVHAAAASGCWGPNEALIRDDCVDAGATDAGDAGTGGAFSDADCK
jgi:hypothetical protein